MQRPEEEDARSDTGEVTIGVDVGNGEFIKYVTYVDVESGLDVCPSTGRLRTREETIANVKEVYAVGREALGADLDRYNTWLAKNSDKEKKLFSSQPAPAATNAATHRAASEHQRTSAASATQPAVVDLTAQAEALKVAGNDALTKGNQRLAITRYTEALELDSSIVALWANRAQANLALKRFDAALEDSEAALAAANGDHEKALFRKAQALKGLQQVKLAHDTAIEGLTRYASKSPASEAVWAPLLRELEAAPSLILTSVEDCSELATGSSGRCAIRAVETRTFCRGNSTRLGELPLHFAWNAEAFARRCPVLVQCLAQEGHRDATRAVGPALLAAVAQQAAAASAAPTAAPSLFATLEQFSVLLGRGFDLTSCADLALIEACLRLAALLRSGDSTLRDEIAAALGLPRQAGDAALEPIFGLYASDADLAEAFAHVAAVTPTTKVVCGDGDEAFVAQLAFLEPEVNRAIDVVAVHTQPVTVRCVRVGDDDQVPLQPSQQVIRDTVNYRLVVDSAAADASTAFGSWLRLHTSAPPTSSGSTRRAVWYGN
jgi:tetratricopeptide (TPR) repeat protein